MKKKNLPTGLFQKILIGSIMEEKFPKA